MAINVEDIDNYMRNNHNTTKEVISIAFDARGQVGGVIFKDKEVLPLFGKELEGLSKYIKDD